MIDNALRTEALAAAAQDPTVAVVLLDVVLGYGAHPDPAGELAPAIERARATASSAGRALATVVSLCGAARDPQGLAPSARVWKRPARASSPATPTPPSPPPR